MSRRGEGFGTTGVNGRTGRLKFNTADPRCAVHVHSDQAVKWLIGFMLFS